MEETPAVTLMAAIKDYAPIAISALALLISVLSYRTVHRNERRTVESTKPLFTARVSGIKGQANWFSIYFSIENRANHGYRCNYIEFRRPWISRGLSFHQASAPKESANPWEGRELIDPLPLERAQRKVPMNFELAKAGTAGSGHSPGATHWGTIYVYVPPWILSLSKSLSMRVSLSSIEGKERESFFAIKRTLPAATKTTTD
jgi:hypothetical protein